MKAIILFMMMAFPAVAKSPEARRLALSDRGPSSLAYEITAETKQNSSSSLALGFRVGPVTSQWVGSSMDGLTKERPLGFSGGLTLSIVPSDRLFWEIGLNFTRNRLGISKNESRADATYNMLELPVMPRFRLLGQFSVGLGGYLAHGVGNFTTKINSSESSRSFSEVQVQSLDAGAVAGAQYRFALGSDSHLVLDAAYYYGLRNANTSKSADEDKAFYRSLRVTIGASFGL